MKKILLILLALSISVFACACGDDRTDEVASSSGEPVAVSDAVISSQSEGSSTFDIVQEPLDLSVDPVEYDADAVEFDFEVADFELNIADNISEADLHTIEGLTDEEKQFILDTKEALLTDISGIFEKIGIDVTIDKVSGEVVLDSSILFDTDSSDVSDAGKDFLEKFIPAYSSVICDEKYADFISEICVEGHTDTEGSYEYNQKLSKDRAESVMDYCLSSDIDIDSSVRSKLDSLMNAYGYSYDKPIKDANGNVDMDASRRVCFSFRINVEGLLR